MAKTPAPELLQIELESLKNEYPVWVQVV